MRPCFFKFAVVVCFSLTAHAAFAHDKSAHGHADDGIGKPGTIRTATRTVRVDMSDGMRFTPATIMAKQGETIRFIITNSGKIKHEFVLGSEKALKEHYEVMKKNPEMEHSDPNMITLAGGQTGEVIWQFSQAGKVDFACLQPGHYDAGMKGKVSVAKSNSLPNGATPAPNAGAQLAAAPAATAAVANSNSTLSDGEIKKIDKSAAKITIKHGPITNLNMPSMTMVFRMRDPSLLDTLQVGDSVKFAAEKSGGAIVVNEIQIVK